VRDWIRRHHLELRYLLIGAILLGGLIAIDRTEVLGNFDHVVTDILDATEGLGAVGMFVIAIVSNCAVFIQIPYNLPMLSAAIGGASVTKMLILGLAAGLGAGIGEIIKYHVAHRVLAKRPNLHRSRLYQWMLRQAEEKPRHVKWIVFAIAATPAPDDTVVVPLAMIRYGARRIAAPLFIGKLVHNLLFAMVFFALSDTAKSVVEGGLRIDLAFGLLVAFFLVVAYQIEKALHHERLAEGSEPETADAGGTAAD
jgi:membrane protein YqaA with SNARE-associated domain